MGGEHVFRPYLCPRAATKASSVTSSASNLKLVALGIGRIKTPTGWINLSRDSITHRSPSSTILALRVPPIFAAVVLTSACISRSYTQFHVFTIQLRAPSVSVP